MTTPDDADGPPRFGDATERLAAFERELAAASEAEDTGDDESEEDIGDDLDDEAEVFRAAGLDPKQYRADE